MRVLTSLPFVALLATPALAQDQCGGIGTGGQWIGGSAEASDIATSDTFREQMALVLAGDEYISLFSVSEETAVRIEAAGRGNGDPQIDILGPDGALIGSDDDSGGNSAARIETTFQPGTYCMKMVSFNGAPMTAFVRIARTDQEPLTEGLIAGTPQVETTEEAANTSMLRTSGSCSDAASMGTLDGPLTNSASANAAPFLSFSLSADSPVTITAENQEADPSISLIDAGGDVLAENDDTDGLNSRIDMSNPLAAGDYCIKVEALSDADAPIDVSVRSYDPAEVLAGLYARGEAAPPMDGSVAITDLGEISNRLRHDARVGERAEWFSFTVPDGGLLMLEANAAGGDGDPWISVYDDLGRQVAMNDDNGDNLDSQVALRVSSGTYLLAVKQVGGAQGFIRLIFERFVPAP